MKRYVIHFTSGEKFELSEWEYKTIISQLDKGAKNYQTFLVDNDPNKSYMSINLNNVTFINIENK